MLNQQQSLYLGFNFLENLVEDIAIHLTFNKKWRWKVQFNKDNIVYSEIGYKSAADAEQDLITFLKNYEGLRNG